MNIIYKCDLCSINKDTDAARLCERCSDNKNFTSQFKLAKSAKLILEATGKTLDEVLITNGEQGIQ